MFLSKIKTKLSIKRSMAFLGLVLLISVKLTGFLSAQSITKGYGSSEVLQRGMIVGLDKNDLNKVEALSSSRINSILGVVVNQGDSPITVTSDKQNIFVATSGRYDVLVSDQQGPISASDYITLSAIEGVGMKASDQQSTIIGRAVNSFNGDKDVLSTVDLKDGKGVKKTVHIARIQVDVLIGKNPLVKSFSVAPAFLTNAGNAISGKSVSAVRLYLSAVIFIVGTVTAGAMLYASIKSSITAVGRNPLSKRSIFRGMASVSLASFTVFLVSLIAIYLVLKL